MHVLQSEMLRLLATVPPGKVRFTIIDPVGLGENFAGFMHLADFDDMLVTNRIWTEPPHIEARLADLTEQMENVIQKYLRNDFETIAEYNEFAGEVAEAFRILVVANFPVNFTETAARRLTSIAASGARCGVHVLMTYDAQHSLPMKFDIEDIQRHSTNLVWEGDKFVWKDPAFEQYPLDRRAAAAGRALHADRATRRRERQGFAARRSAVRADRPDGRQMVGRQHGQGNRCSARPRRCDEVAASAPRARHVAARSHRRQNRLRKIDAVARADYQSRADVQPRRNRAVSDRLQERASSSRPTRRKSCPMPA